MARRFIFRLFHAAQPASDHVPDAELLRRYARDQDSAAFELLVRRHADTVWAACNRVLRNEADADDAFQAAFLVLARKAGSVRNECVGGWLHRVAVNAALKLKASGRREPAGGLPDDHPAHAGRSPDPELATVVHQELARLPDRYRLPVVLCDLEGHTHAEAAKVLNWPVGSVSGRLSRAHALLRDRLTRRGLAAPAAIAAVLSAVSAPARAVSAAAGLAAGSIPVPPAVSTLTEGVLSAMRTAKIQFVVAVVAVTGLLGLAGTGTVLALTRPGPAAVPAPAPNVPLRTPEVAAVVPAAEPPIEGNWIPDGQDQNKRADPKLVPSAFPDLKPPTALDNPNYEAQLAKLCPRILGDAAPITIEATDDNYRRLLKARIHQGRLELRDRRLVLQIGKWDSSFYVAMVDCQEDMRAAAQELWANDAKALIPWLEEFVILAKEFERFTEARVRNGSDPPYALYSGQRHRLKVEAALWKAKNAAGGR
jgi:RNA polymerase sigma factor (sigma-70 family)